MDKCEECPGTAGMMTVDECRRQQRDCSRGLYKSIDDLKKVVYLIAGRFGIRVNGSSTEGVDTPDGLAHHRDGELETHLHRRIADLEASVRKTVAPEGGDGAGVRLPRWAAIMGAAAFILAGVGIILMYQTKTDLEKIIKVQQVLTGTPQAGK